MRKFAIHATVIVVSWTAILPAQVTGRLTGSVVDASRAAVPGVAVSLLFPNGRSPVLRTNTTSEGLFSFSSIRPESYDLTVEAPGFAKQVLRGIQVQPGRETPLAAIQLELSSIKDVVEVAAHAEGVQIGNAEVSTTVTNQQIRRLPVIDRDPISLILTQAGVAQGIGPVVINGQRASFTNVTLDGINIQDNYIRANGLTYQPNLLLLDQISEFTITTSNSNASVGGGASQISYATPSGTNVYHGSAYWYNRNNALAANTWFNNKDGLARPFLNQNQVGGSLGGYLIRDKLFYYTNYEVFRLRQTSTADRVILTEDARRGIFTYPDQQGVLRKVNVLEAGRVQIDPVIQKLLAAVPGPERINNFRLGDSRPGLLRNTAGYSFPIRDNRTRDNVTAKLDYVLSSKNVFSGSYVWNRDNVDRPSDAAGFSTIPKVLNEVRARFASVAWRWSPKPALTNELRGGFNLAPGVFRTSEAFGPYLIAGTLFDNPIDPSRPEGRHMDTYALMDNATWVRGKHNLQFGFHTQQIRVESFDEFDTIPTYALGFSSRNRAGLTAAQVPGASVTDRDGANALLATLAGYVASYTQKFNITNRSSGFVSGAPNLRHYTFDNYAFYVQDSWKLMPRLSLTLGLRYEYFTVVNERDSLALFPRIQNNDPAGTLLSNATLDFAGSTVGRPWYNQDKNNFAPNIGLAWNVFGNGKTALRAAYSIHYVNDETILAVTNSAETNAGLQADSARFDLTGRLSSGLPAVPVPEFKVPRTFADNYFEDPTNAFGLVDPNLRTPYVQQWSFGIQHEFKGTVFDIRYVGNHATKALRAIDYNQVVIRENGFLADFQRALNNGNLARSAAGAFNPTYNPGIPGSQRLTVFPLLDQGGLLGNSTVRSLIETGQAGQLAATYQIEGLNGDVNFFRNPFALGTNLMSNFSNSTYNALQVEARRRTRAGLDFQANYTYSKVLSDSVGDLQVRFEPFLDNNNPKIERARPIFDLTHVFNVNAIYDLPLGQGHRLDYAPLRRLLGGWAISSTVNWQSGSPFSILSERGTLNRGGFRSSANTASSPLNKSQLDALFAFRQTADGPFFAAASTQGSDGRAVAPDGASPFSGQVFFHPGPGMLGGLQRRMFSGPAVFGMDFAVLKTTRLSERHSLELRLEASNILNHPTWVVGDQNISSVNFGRINSVFYDCRLMQLSLHYRF